MKNKNLNKDTGDTEKINLDSFLRIRKKTIIQFLNENNIDSLENFYLFIVNNFTCSTELYDEVKTYFNITNSKEEIKSLESIDSYESNVTKTETKKPKKAKKTSD